MAASEVAATVVATIVALGGGKFFVDMFTARSKGKKEGAESQAILVSSASEFARNVVARLDHVQAEFDRYRRDRELYEMRQRQLFQAHAEWDLRLRQVLKDRGEDVPAPPPLYENPIARSHNGNQ